ncbi:MAG TPA: Asp-tRNA(Asn)/Glu-tRNA(Gln) amidotransferase subunit GatC [Planctomycetota bacterium]
MTGEETAGFDLRRTARLAGLGLGEGEAATLQRDLAAILAFVDQVRALPLAGLEPAIHALADPLAAAADVVAPSLPVDAVLARAPATHQGFVRVPPILPPAPAEGDPAR